MVNLCCNGIICLIVLWERFVALDELDVISQRVPILKLLSGEHKIVLIRRDVLFLSHFSFNDTDGICQFGLDRDGLACEGWRTTLDIRFDQHKSMT